MNRDRDGDQLGLHRTAGRHLPQPLVRHGRALAHGEGSVQAGMDLVGCAYNFCWEHDSLRVAAPAGSGPRGVTLLPADEAFDRPVGASIALTDGSGGSFASSSSSTTILPASLALIRPLSISFSTSALCCCSCSNATVSASVARSTTISRRSPCGS